jgi:ABC-type Fe3+/spermidine/putrescine transport system ATPase subunit
MIRVELRNLTKHFRPPSREVAVHELTLDVEPGQITVLLGPSGCGKTTTLKLIAGLLHPTSGDILFDGRSVLTVPAERRGAVMVFQNRLLFPYMTVGENVGFGLAVRGHDKATIRRRVEEMLELVHLPGVASRRPHQLSGGQQQRVALARALVVEPRVLLLDEPLSNLDAHLRDEMRELVLEIQRKLRITTILVTHDQTEAVMMADRIALMLRGSLRQCDVPRAFYRHPFDVETARFFGGVNFVPGHRRGDTVETDVGSFPAPPDCQPGDGPVVVTVRPEDLALGPVEGDGLLGGVTSSTYLGVQARFQVEVGEQMLQVIEDVASIDRFPPGDRVRVLIPTDKIWLLPLRSADLDAGEHR